MDCLFASVNIIITDCCLAELEKLGPQYRLALMSEFLPTLPVTRKHFFLS